MAKGLLPMKQALMLCTRLRQCGARMGTYDPLDHRAMGSLALVAIQRHLAQDGQVVVAQSLVDGLAHARRDDIRQG